MAGIQTNASLTGDRDLARLMQELPRRVIKKGLRAAMSAAATPVAKAMRRDAPQESGTLKKAISKKIKSYPTAVTALVGVNKDAAGEFRGRRRVPEKYLHLILAGTAPHQIGRNANGPAGKHPGTKPNDFRQRAFNETAATAQAIARQKLTESIETEAEKLKGKGA